MIGMLSNNSFVADAVTQRTVNLPRTRPSPRLNAALWHSRKNRESKR